MAVYTDNFDSYANNSNLAGQGNWVVAIGTSDSIKVYKPASDGEINPNQSGAMAVMYSGTFSNDQYSQITYTAENLDHSIGVAVRLTSASSGSGYLWFSDASSSYFIRVNSGVEDWGATALYGTSWTVGDVVKLEVVGSTIKFYRNGSLDTSMSGDGIVTDTTYSSGNPGVCSYNASTSTRADDWEGGDVATYAGVLYIYTGSEWRPSPLSVYGGPYAARPVWAYISGKWQLIQSF